MRLKMAEIGFSLMNRHSHRLEDGLTRATSSPSFVLVAALDLLAPAVSGASAEWSDPNRTNRSAEDGVARRVAVD